MPVGRIKVTETRVGDIVLGLGPSSRKALLNSIR